MEGQGANLAVAQLRLGCIRLQVVAHVLLSRQLLPARGTAQPAATKAISQIIVARTCLFQGSRVLLHSSAPLPSLALCKGARLHMKRLPTAWMSR